MKTKLVKREIDLQSPSPLSEEQRARLSVLAKMPDSDIDYSDIPPLGDDFWKNAVRNPFYKPTKQVTTVRVDSDVLLWLKGQGKGYQTRINAILREAMLRAIHDKA
ncbi:BrnA antitoxin family protein [Polaromonas glacialis]|uniref:BrnA antitoxin family protein n=1 Tax=Polaromonas glacialis TaxID=866564 RepID=UPI0004958047|nr:BrnA antitoxin family protein [Polaromonas glacialis]